MQVGVRMLVIIIKHTGTYPWVGTCSSAEDTKDRLLLGNQAGSYRDLTYIHTSLLHRNEKIDDHNDADNDND